MKRLAQQYAAWRNSLRNRGRALRNAISDCGINPHRLLASKMGSYHHDIHNWNWRT